MLLAIDPGYNAMGFAIFDKTRAYSRPVLTDCGTMKALKGKTWFESFQDFQDDMKHILKNQKPHRVVCEEMALMGGQVGYATARTSLLGLAGIVGMWAWWALQQNIPFQLAPVVQWKGQLPKTVVNKRLRKILRPHELALLSKPASHDWDACGIGLWSMGFFK